DDFYGQVDVPTNLVNAVSISAGFYHSLALTSDGKVIAWGMSTNDTSIGTDPNYGQTRIPGSLSNVVAISAGGWHNLALTADGTVQGWGRNDDGQPDIPAGLNNVGQIAAGAVHSLAVQLGTLLPSRVILTNSVFTTNGFSVELPTRSGHVYRLEYRDSLTGNIWTPLPLVAGAGRVTSLTDPSVPAARRFYRVRQW